MMLTAVSPALRRIHARQGGFDRPRASAVRADRWLAQTVLPLRFPGRQSYGAVLQNYERISNRRSQQVDSSDSLNAESRRFA
jgi:hypothetical protein